MENVGKKIYNLAERLFPICRSITGEGVRETLTILKEYIQEGGDDIKFNIYNIPSNTRVFDWTVPKEWVIKDAYIEDKNHNRVIDFKENNLHVMGYSIPVDAWVELDELKEHIFTQTDQPDVIPYITSYYEARYGFCMSENLKRSLKPGKYHMYINSALIDGNLTYGEVILPGESDEEVFFSTYICHPSMANNECSGPALSAEIIRYINSLKQRRYTYRFVFIPETIGSIAYLSRNLEYLKAHMIAGFNLTCVGDDRDYSIVETRYADTLADRVLKNVLRHREKYTTYSFLDRGSDERQYNAVGVELPVVCYCRSKFNTYKEYHTSADNLTVITPNGFQGSYEVITQVINALEYNVYYKMRVLCEPQLGKYGLRPTISRKENYVNIKNMANFIAYADGRNDLIGISDIIDVPMEELILIVEQLMKNELIEIFSQEGHN